MDRLLPIELVTDGDARVRSFPFDPVEFAEDHRLEIIAEILGLAILYLKNGQKPWDIPKDMDCRFKKWMQVVGAILELRGIDGFMSNTVRMESELDSQQQEFEELARRVFTAKGNAWLSATEVLDYCKTGSLGNPEGPALQFQETKNSKQPAKQLAKYVLAPRVLKPVNIEQDEVKPRQLVRLELIKNSSTHNNEYRFEPVSGGAVVSRKNDEGLPPQANLPSIKDLQDCSGGKGGNSIQGNSIYNTNNIKNNNCYGIPRATTTVYHRTTANPDPWEGAEI
jgi:hypothetical protein